MKRHINFWLVMFLAISLALPIYSMAQTTKLTLESSTGDRISTPGIKSFSVGTDNNLVIYLDQPFNFTALLPDITVDDTAGTYSNCTVSSPASVTATQGVTLSFMLRSLTANAQFSPIVVNPEDGIATFNASTKVFNWPTGGSPPVATGSYLAVFEATAGTDKSQLVVMIKINPPETVTAPTVSGPSTGIPGVSYQFTASGSTSSLNHAIEYQFDWGDGNQSGWSASPQSHSWATASTTPYSIKAKARCVPDHVESAWSAPSSITISNIPSYTVTVSIVNPAGGSVSPTSRTVPSGGTATFTVTINSGYTASVSEGALSGTTGTVTWTITNVTSTHTATITFTQSGGGGGGAGTKANPLKLNTPTPKYPTRYATAASALKEGEFALAPNSKTYFVIDPLQTTGRSVSAFAIQVMTYNQTYTICKAILQDKITGNFIRGGVDEVCRGSVGFREIVYDNGTPYAVEIDNTRFIYAIENPYGSTFTATITIFADIP